MAVTDNSSLFQPMAVNENPALVSAPKKTPSRPVATGDSSLESLESQLSNIDALIEEANSNERVIELSVVMPCLNEADTLATCIEKCNQVFKDMKISAEIVIADNGSTDGSIQIAERLGARIIHVEARGYGNALRAGISAARGQYVIMGDANDSYDFLEIPKFIGELRAGWRMVQGCRLPSGGGEVLPEAMPFLHRWVGNPMFSGMVKQMFNAPVNDVYCGLRGFTKELYEELDLRCTGMEFSSEMVIKSSLFHHDDIAEVPITLHSGDRAAHADLNTFREGWRTLRFFLVYSPKYLFQVPGITLMMFGLLAYALALPGIQLLGAGTDAFAMLFGALGMLVGFQLLQFAVFSKTFAIEEGLMPKDASLTRYTNWFTLERGLIAGSGMLVAGTVILGVAVNQWMTASFGALDYASTMRIVIPGLTMAAIGVQTIASSFFLGVLKLGRRDN